MPHPALEHDRHGLEAAKRVVGETAGVGGRGIAAEGVEHEQRVESLLQRQGQDVRKFHAVAIGSRLTANDAFDAARAKPGGNRSIDAVGVATVPRDATPQRVRTQR